MTPVGQDSSTPGVIAQSAPGIAFTVVNWLLDIPVEKWVSVVTLIFVSLQVIFLVRDRFKKRKVSRQKREDDQ